MNEYGFTIGEQRTFFVEAENEKEALIKLINEKWLIIEEILDLGCDAELITCHGLVIEKQKGFGGLDEGQNYN